MSSKQHFGKMRPIETRKSSVRGRKGTQNNFGGNHVYMRNAKLTRRLAEPLTKGYKGQGDEKPIQNSFLKIGKMKNIILALAIMALTSCQKEQICGVSTCQYIKYSFTVCPAPETTVFELSNLRADTSIFTVNGCPDEAEKELREGLLDENMPEPYNRLEQQYPSSCNCW